MDEKDEKTKYVPRSFASSKGTGGSARDGDAEGIDEGSLDEGPLERQPVATKALIAVVMLFVLAIGCVVGAVGFSDSDPSVSDEDSSEIFALREQIQTAQAQAKAMPSMKDADRSLVRALQAANDVAHLQNKYRILAKAAASDKGLDQASVQDTSRSLTPYFAPDTDASMLDPWYLLASDATVDMGIGIPETFGSGFEWQAQVPSVINQGGSVSVSWIAIETRTNGDRAPQVLAWTQANYDTIRQVFTDVKVGMTSTGKALGLEVNL